MSFIGGITLFGGLLWVLGGIAKRQRTQKRPSWFGRLIRFQAHTQARHR